MSDPAFCKLRSMIRRFCISRVKQAQRHSCSFGPGHGCTLGKGIAIGRRQQAIPFLIKRNRGHISQGFVVDVGQTGIDPEIGEKLKDLLRRAREHRVANLRMAGLKGRCQSSYDGKRGRNGRNAQVAGQAALQRLHFLPKPARIGDDPPRPLKDALALMS